jgi:hypothetical protein
MRQIRWQTQGESANANSIRAPLAGQPESPDRFG